ETCQKIMDSKAYPVLDPLMALLKKNFEESLQKKNKKVQKTKVKKSKAADKVVKVQHKIQRSKMLSNFFEALTTSDDKKSAFLVGMKAVHEDSTFRTNTKLNKLNQKLKAQKAKLENPNLSNEERQKISNKISKLQQKLSKLSDKLKRLAQLDQNLTEIAELPKEQIERLAQVTAEQVQTAIEDNANINKAVDEVAQKAAESTNEALGKEQTKTVEETAEQNKIQDTETQQTEKKGYSLFSVVADGGDTYYFKDNSNRSLEQLLKDFNKIGTIKIADGCEQLNGFDYTYLLQKQQALPAKERELQYEVTIDKDARTLRVFQNDKYKNANLDETLALITDGAVQTSKGVKRKITSQQALALMSSEVKFDNIKRLKKTGELYVYYDRAVEKEIKACLQQTQTAKIKR
ncbi:MAG: hypothetical protein ACI4M3_05580, partial [Acutalibacteraceae bacterium]